MMRPDAEGRPVILVVEDERAVRSLLQAPLCGLGYDVLAAAGGAEAVDLYRLAGGRVGLVLLDVRMPGLDGVGTLDALRALDPAVNCLFMSGNTEPYTESHLARRSGRGLLRKPFRREQLAVAVRAALGGRGVPGP
jgi:CheY-like chemotaxis protein